MKNNTGIIWGIIILVVIVIGGSLVLGNSMKAENEAMMEKDTMIEQDSMMQATSSMMKEDSAMMKSGSYEAYSSDKVAMASASQDVILFFHAPWCPTCKALDTNINANLTEIPADLTILKTDYDSSVDLKKKYGVTYQHTFVQVDANGNMIKKWSGSPTLSSLVSQVQ